MSARIAQQVFKPTSGSPAQGLYIRILAVLEMGNIFELPASRLPNAIFGYTRGKDMGYVQL